MVNLLHTTHKLEVLAVQLLLLQVPLICFVHHVARLETLEPGVALTHTRVLLVGTGAEVVGSSRGPITVAQVDHTVHLLQLFHVTLQVPLAFFNGHEAVLARVAGEQGRWPCLALLRVVYKHQSVGLV